MLLFQSFGNINKQIKQNNKNKKYTQVGGVPDLPGKNSSGSGPGKKKAKTKGYKHIKKTYPWLRKTN